MMNKITEWRRSKTLVLVVVTTALLLDSTMVTVIVPILPNYFDDLSLNKTLESPLKTTAEPSLNTTVEVSSKISENKTLSIENNISKYLDENKEGSVELGLLFASKSFFQIIVAPFVGFVTDRYGFSIPMFTGFIVMFISTLTFAFASSYSLLFIARSIQGVSSALSTIPGLAMLSYYYPDDKERGNAMGIAFGGTGLGVLIAPTLGAFAYEQFGKPAPFLIIAGFALIDGCLRLFVADPKSDEKTEKPKDPSLLTLFKDPYIMISTGSLFLMHFGVAFLEPSLPARMKNVMNASSTQQGLAFLPISLTRLLTTTLVARVGFSLGRYLTALLGLILSAICLAAIPFCKTMTLLIIPNSGLGLSLAMIESSILPFLGNIVDLRHDAAYGNVFAIADTSFCLSYCIGPALSGFMIDILGFNWSLQLIAALCLLYAPLLYFLRNPRPRKKKNEKQESIAL